MALIERSETMPQPKQGWQTFARTRSGDVIRLNTKLSLGERLFGKYGPFWQIDTRRKEHRQRVSVRSRTGRLAFDVEVRVTYSLKTDDPDQLIDVADPVAHFVMPAIETEARSVARTYAIQDYDLFNDALSSALDPRRSLVAHDTPVTLHAVLVEADMPADLVSVEEQKAMLDGLDGRVALAELRGETEAAQRMRNAANAMREFVRRRAEDLSFKADEIIDIRRKINAMIDEGYGEDNTVVRSLLAQIDNMAQRTTDGAATPPEPPAAPGPPRTPGRGGAAALDKDPEDAD